MMTEFGAGKINPNACTEAELRRNFQVIVNQITEITEGGATDTFKVAVDASDFTPTYAGPNYLYPKLYNQSTFDEESHQRVYAEVYDDSGDLKVNLFTALAEGGGGDDHKVLVSATDSTYEYLYASMKDTGTYASETDILVLAEIADASANEKLRLFVRIGDDLVGKVFNNITVIGGSFAEGVLTVDEKYRLIRGQVVSNILAGAATFYIDNIELLAGSLDPRLTPGDLSELLEIYKTDVQSALGNNDWITAIYNNLDGQWEWLCTERSRSIRGEYVSGSAILTIDHIVVLDSGLDPRSDPTSTSETVGVVRLVDTDSYASGEKVFADWNAKDGVWEARPKYRPSTTTFGTVVEAAAADGGTGTYYAIDGELTPLDANGDVLVTDSEDPEFDQDTYDAALLSFTNAHRYVDIPVGARIVLHSVEIKTGENVGLFVQLGMCADVLDYLFGVTGFATLKALAVPETGAVASDIQWLGNSCD